MADMIGFSRLGAPAAFVTPTPPPVAQPKPSTGVVAVSGGSGGAAASGNSALPRQTAQDRAPTPVQLVASDNRKADLEPQPPLDPDVQTGPPPTFEATLLQLEAALRMSLARIDAARALKSDPPLPDPKEREPAALSDVSPVGDREAVTKPDVRSVPQVEKSPVAQAEPKRQPDPAANTNTEARVAQAPEAA